MENRIVELEIKVAYQDRLIADLDGVVKQFADRVELLERRIKELEDTAKNPPEHIGPADDPPPHY
jgi:SlyX protein